MQARIAFFLILILLFFKQSASFADTQDCRITYYDISVVVPDSFTHLEVRASLDIAKLSPESELVLILGKDFTGVKVSDIEICNDQGDAIGFEQKEDTLIINEEEEIPPELTISYKLEKGEDYEKDKYSPFAFEVSPALCHINAAITRTDNWYPKIAGAEYQRLPAYRLAIEVPSQLKVMASGMLKSSENHHARTQYHWVNYPGITDRSLYFFARECKRQEVVFDDDFQVIMYVPVEAKEENIAQIAGVIYKSYSFFCQRFGRAAGNEYKIMAFPYGYSGLFNSMTAPESLFTGNIENNDIGFPMRTLIHEVSHTWWGNVVSANAETDYWLYEGFAKFSEIIAIKPALDMDVEDESFYRLKLFTLPYIEYAPSILGAGAADNRVLQRVSAYYGGATFLNMLKFILGEESFYRGIVEYTTKFRGKSVTTDDFKEIMQAHTLKNLNDLFSQYLASPGYARYTIERIATRQKGKKFMTAFKIDNTGDKDIHTELLKRYPGRETMSRFNMDKDSGRVVTFTSDMEADLDDILIDPQWIFPICEEGLKGAGGIVFRNQAGDIKFMDVLETSILSSSGIKDNMSLLSIGGEDLTGKNLCELNSLLLRHSGTTLTIEIESGEVKREVVLEY